MRKPRTKRKRSKTSPSEYMLALSTLARKLVDLYHRNAAAKEPRQREMRNVTPKTQ